MKKRVISAIFLIIIFGVAFYFGGYVYKIFMTVLSLFGLWEFFKLEKHTPLALKIIFYVFDVGLMAYELLFTEYNAIIPLLGLLIILLACSNTYKNNGSFHIGSFLRCLSLGFINIILFYCLVHVIDIGVKETIYVFVISTITDTFALFCGKYFGKHKLAPKVSPNKTIEGSIGGAIFGTLIPTIMLHLLGYNCNIFLIMLMSFILSLVGQLGDLFFSSIKRFYKVKDYSNLIPGHGGILDRLDNVLFVAALFSILVKLF